MEENRPSPDTPDSDDRQSGRATARSASRNGGSAGDDGQRQAPQRSTGRDSADRGGGTALPEGTNRQDSAQDGGEVRPEDFTGDVPANVDRPMRELLHPGESLDAVSAGTLVGETSGPATVGLTDRRFLAVTDAGEFVTAGFEKICSVRSHADTVPEVRGNDARLLFGVGYLFAIIGFVGVLASASNALTPALTLVTLGGALGVLHVQRDGFEIDDATLAPLVERLDDDQTDRMRRVAERVTAFAAEETLALLCVGALALAPFLAIVGVEGGLLVPLFTLVTVGSILLVVHAFRHGDAYDGLELAMRRQRTVTATLDDGSSVSVRTPADSNLDRELSGRVGAQLGPDGREVRESH